MRSTFSGMTRSSGPPLAFSFAARSRPVSDRSDVASQRSAMAAQVIGLPSRSTAPSLLARSTTLSVIGNRDGGLAARRQVVADQAIDQTDFTAGGVRDIGAVHAVDDARE